MLDNNLDVQIQEWDCWSAKAKTWSYHGTTEMGLSTQTRELSIATLMSIATTFEKYADPILCVRVSRRLTEGLQH